MILKQKYLRVFVRYILVAMVSVILVLLLFTGTTLGTPGVAIPDENLRSKLAEALDKPTDDPIVQRLTLITLASQAYKVMGLSESMMQLVQSSMDSHMYFMAGPSKEQVTLLKNKLVALRGD